MKYLVMECHPGYAVVLDENGRFLRVANQNYKPGQKVAEVMELKAHQFPNHRALFSTLAACAACLCLLILGAWQLMTPYGTVRMQINPDISLRVNRFDYVLDITPLNADGEVLLKGYDPGIQKVDAVLDALSDRAAQMGFLKEDGEIKITVQSSHKDWQVATQDRLIAQLELHTADSVIVTPVPDGEIPTEPAQTQIPTQPQQTEPIWTEGGHWDDNDDVWDDDDDNDEDDDDDEEEDDDDEDDDDDESEERKNRA